MAACAVPNLARGQYEFFIRITNVVDGQFFAQAPTNLPVEVEYRNAESTVLLVEYFSGDTKVGEAAEAPFSWVWTNAPSGTNLLYAKATDGFGAVAVSSNITLVINHPPTVSLAQPLPGQLVDVAIGLTAAGSVMDVDGTITNVAFYLDSVLVAQTNAAGPFSLVFSNLALGGHSFAVVAEDNWGLRNQPVAPAFEVIVPDDGIWEDFEPGLDAASWSAFGGEVGVDVIATNYGGAVSGNNSLWFDYDDLRYAVTRPLALRAGSAVDFQLRLAAGEAPNWNAVALPFEAVALEYSTNGVDWAPMASFADESFTNWQRVILPVPSEALGTNTQFRWVQWNHGGTGFSHWALDDVQVTTGPTPPTILAQPQNVIGVEGQTVSFAVQARGSPPLVFQWTLNGSAIPGATNAMLALPRLALRMNGNLYAVVVSNALGVVTSATARLTVGKAETDLFRIVAFGTNGAVVIDHDSLTGDDRGGIAVSSNLVFITGDSYTARYNAAGLTGGVRLNSTSGQVYDGLVANLRTETVYSLANGTNPIYSSSTRYIDGLLEMNSNTGAFTGNRIPLSSPIDCSNAYGVGIFSGSDRIVIHTGSRAYHIALPSGVVSDLGDMPYLNYYYSESWAYWGVVECFSNSLYLVYVGNQIYTNSTYVAPIMRARVPDGEMTPLQLFTSLGDMSSFTLSFSRQRWYFHHESSSQFATGGEKLGYLPVTLDFGGGSAPMILVKPLDQYVPYGGNVSLAVADAGSLPRAYQWYRGGEPLAGATAAVLSITNVQSASEGQYFVVISNPYGSITSSVINVTGGIAPKISTHPASQSALAGTDVELSVGASGSAPLQYQWYFQYYYNPIWNATNRVLRLENIQLDREGDYYVVVSNNFGAVTSKTATLTVLSPPVIVGDPNNIKTLPARTATFSVQTIGTEPMAYQWFQGSNLIAGATLPELTLKSVSPADLGEYYVVITNQYGAATSAVATLSFLEPIPGTFRITALLTNHSKVVDHNSLTGDDRGGIAISSNYVFYSGDNATARFNAADLAGGTALGRIYDFLVSNLRTETIYSFGTGTNLLTDRYTSARVDTLIELHGTTLQPVGRYIQLSQPFTNYTYNGLLCAGYDRVVYWDGSSQMAYDIALPSGQVTVYGPVSLPDKSSSESWASWGVAEVFDGLLWLAYVGGNNPTNSAYKQIVRACVADGVTTPVAEFYDPDGYYALSDMACFTVSLARQRWYFHYEGSSTLFGGQSETIGYADATFLVSSSNDPPRLVSQPQDTRVPLGSTATLGAQVIGADPLHCQWWFNGEALPEATNTTLMLPNFQWINEGDYFLVVTNALGAVTSQTARVLVDAGSLTNRVFLFGITNQWKYNQQALNLGTAWRETNYNDAAWPTGRGLLAWEDNAAITPYINTPLSLTNSSGTRVITYYFRTWVMVPNFPGASRVQLVSSNLVDDGALLYLNGNEQGRLRFSEGATVTYSSLATTATEGVYNVVPFRFNDATMGTTNLIAVEVHQSSTTSSDVVFGMGLYADVIYPLRPPVIVESPQSQSHPAGAALSLNVVATGFPLYYRWWRDGALVAAGTNATLRITNALPSLSGVYSVVVSNSLGSVTSAPAVVTIVGPRFLAPVLTPADGAFHLRFSGALGTVYELQVSEDLGAWTALGSLTNLTGEIEFLDYGATNFVRRYYRLRLLP